MAEYAELLTAEQVVRVHEATLDAHARAMAYVRELLPQDNSARFSTDLDAEIRQKFPDLVAGDSRPPAGWKSPLPTSRSVRRRRTGRGRIRRHREGS